MSKLKFQPLTGYYDFDVEFPCGTPEEIYDYLIDVRDEFILKFNRDKDLYSSGVEDCVITSSTFTEQYTYSGCDYVFRIHYRETEDAFQKRCADQIESEKRKAAAKIKRLETELKKLKGE